MAIFGWGKQYDFLNISKASIIWEEPTFRQSILGGSSHLVSGLYLGLVHPLIHERSPGIGNLRSPWLTTLSDQSGMILQVSIWLVVWNMNFMTFHSVGNFIIPTVTHSLHHFSEG